LSCACRLRRPADRKELLTTVKIVFTLLLVITSLLMIVLILLHKGKGGGLSDMFGGGVSSSLGGSSIAERNLDRITLAIGILWAASIIGLGLIAKTAV
jgi:preprotein translocase subunit SecG